MAKGKSKESNMGQAHQDAVHGTSQSLEKEMGTFQKYLEDAVRGTDKVKTILFGLDSHNHIVEVEVNPKKVAEILLEYKYPYHLATRTSAPNEMWQKLSKLAGLVVTSNVVMQVASNKNPNTKN